MHFTGEDVAQFHPTGPLSLEQRMSLVLRQFARRCNCPTTSVFPRNVTVYAKVDHPHLRDRELEFLCADDAPNAPSMYFLEGDECSYWINSLSSAVYFCFLDMQGTFKIRVVLGTSKEEELGFVPKQMLKIRESFATFDGYTVKGGLYARDANHPKAEYKAYALYMTQPPSRRGSQSDRELHLFRMEQVPTEVVHMAERSISHVGQPFERRNADAAQGQDC